MSAKWYTLWTKPGCEKKVVNGLKKKNLEAYCPMKKVHSSWLRREDMQPLIPGHVFVKLEEDQKTEAKHVHGVISFLHWLNAPAVVKDTEINMLKRLTADYEHINVEKVPVNKPLVRVVKDEDHEQLTIPRKRLLKATLPSIGYAVSVTVKEEVAEYENIAYMYPYYQYTDAI